MQLEREKSAAATKTATAPVQQSSAQTSEAPAPGKFHDFTPAELQAMAQNCEIRIDLPPIEREPYRMSPETGARLHLSDTDQSSVSGALDRMRAGDSLDPLTLAHEIRQKTPPAQLEAARTKIARERAGILPAPMNPDTGIPRAESAAGAEAGAGCRGEGPLRQRAAAVRPVAAALLSLSMSNTLGDDRAATPDTAGTMPSMPAVIAERYSIKREIGHGGMGRVFAAHDGKLDRDVAVKVLAPGTHGEEALRRFEQEARAAGSLNHPNVLAVYDVGAHEGGPYIVSELLEGAPLRERLAGKTLPIAKAIDFALQLAEGLAAAHDKGVIHRDLKPENVFVTNGGRVKILDFGIAKLATRDAAPARPQTQTGTIMGTVGYMSPEQVRGEHADPRSDLFTFGSILHEMLSGKAPFDRPTSLETGSAILNDEPPDLPQAVPRELARVVRRCLEKSPAERVQSAHEVALALARLSGTVAAPATSRWRWLAAGAALAALVAAGLLVPRLRARTEPAEGRSIAVLPFVNMSSDKQNDYFSDGMTEELISALANIDGLRVVSRTAVFGLKGQNLEVRQIGDKLNVNVLLEGSVRREGNELRVTAQLINVSDGYHLWSKSYDRELKSVFALEDEIARSIAQALRHKLLGSAVKPSTTSQEAHDLYLKGRYFWNKRNAEALHQAASCFQQAIDKDPAYALAYVGLADATTARVDYEGASPAEVLPVAKRAALHALELDPGLAEAHASLGLISFFDYDWQTALNEFRTAIELKPDFAAAHKYYGQALIGIGEPEKGLAELERAREEDPTSLIISNNIAYSHFIARDYDGAVSRLKKNLEMDPSFELSHLDLATTYMLQGKFDDALAELDKVRQAPSDVTEAVRARILARAGRRAEALQVLHDMEERSGREHVRASQLGIVWVALGDRDRAFALFEKACSERDSRLDYLKSDPSFDPVRSDPRFKQLLKCVHLE